MINSSVIEPETKSDSLDRWTVTTFQEGGNAKPRTDWSFLGISSCGHLVVELFRVARMIESVAVRV
jgi:hypothetical protein